MHHSGDAHTDLGIIKIHRNVIASIAAIAAIEIEGVKEVGESKKNVFLSLLDKKGAKGIKVEIDKNEEVKVVIPVTIRYGFNIPDIANKVQENVRTNLEKMTNLSIKDININVQGVERGEN
jgi:uncharacterized alkaline shock family protein YloU